MATEGVYDFQSGNTLPDGDFAPPMTPPGSPSPDPQPSLVKKKNGKKRLSARCSSRSDLAGSKKQKTNGINAPPDSPPAPLSRYRRAKDTYTFQEKLPGGVHIEDYMTKGDDFPDLGPEELHVVLQQLEEKYLIKSDDEEEIREHSYRIFGLDPAIEPEPCVIDKQRKMDLVQLINVYQAFQKYDIVGGNTDDQLEIEKRFSRLFESVSVSTDLLISEHRARAFFNANFNVAVPEEVAFYKYRKPDFKNLNNQQNLIVYALRRASEDNLRRYDGHCYREIVTDGGYRTRAWERLCSLREFLHRICDRTMHPQQWRYLTTSGAVVHFVLDYLEHSEDPEFPMLQVDRHSFSFRNGIYFAEDGNFAFYGEGSVIPEGTVTSKFFDLDFDFLEYSAYQDWYAIPTPGLQTIMDYQGWPEEVCRTFYGFMGRCLYDLNERDKWQVAPYVKGVAGSGKSTMGKVIQNFYHAEHTGVMSNNMEPKFGLSQLFHKFVYVCYELKSNFKGEQSDIQSVIVGEDMSLPVKNKTAIVGEWKPPGIWLGNEGAKWLDAQGSMTRRFVLWECKRPVVHANPNLDREIQAEMPAIIYKANRAYNCMVTEIGPDRGIWDWVPPYFKETQKRLSIALSPLRGFLENEDRLNFKSKGGGLYMPEDEFWRLHDEFGKLHKIKMPRVEPDYYSCIFEEYSISLEKKTTRQWKGRTTKRNWIVGVGLADGYDSNAIDTDGPPEVEK